MRRLHTLTKQALTLVEILVTIAIVASVLAILFPVVIRAKERALDSQETGQLRQIAIAHSLYKSDFDDVEPASTVPLIAGGYVKPDLVRSPRDPYANGWANEHRKGAPEPKTPYKDSFRTLASGRDDVCFAIR